MLISQMTCRSWPSVWSVAVDSDVLLAALMAVTAEKFRLGGRDEGFVNMSEPSPFCGARASDMAIVGSRQHNNG